MHRKSPSRQRFFGVTQLTESSFPSLLKLAGNQPVVRIDAVELTLGQRGLIAQPLNLLFLRTPQRFVSLALCLASARQGIDLRWSDRLEESNANLRVDRCRPEALANRNAVMLMQVITNVDCRPCSAQPSCGRTRRTK
jgi:hypothetical protein